MMLELWQAIRGKRTPIAHPAHLEVRLPEEDEGALAAYGLEPPDYLGGLVSGFACIISYRDARGRASDRRITCQQINRAGEYLYVVAFCHEREARRQFRVDRIETIADLKTGELIQDALAFFGRFQLDNSRHSALTWGLSVRKRADLIAGLNALVFVGRCDREWHPLEEEVLERFVASYWLHREVPGEPPLGDIIAHAERLSPDAETFYVSLARCDHNPPLARLFRNHIRAMVDADARLTPEECYWGQSVDDYLSGLVD